jgi:hypothetical protein
MMILTVGCGGGGPSAAVGQPQGKQTIGPHGGVAVPLGETGYAELVAEPIGDGTRAKLALYILSPDLKASHIGTASGVSVDLQTPNGAINTVLQPASGTDATGKNRHEAGPGVYELEGVSGKVILTLDGQAYEVSVSPN